MKILSATQTRQLDSFTIENEPIASIDLMERASLAFTNWFTEQFPTTQPVHIFCGIGNNGGDGLAIARLLHERSYPVEVYTCTISEKTSDDFATNRERLKKLPQVHLHSIQKGDKFPVIPKNAIILDAIFGSGLNRPVEGYWGKLLEHLNQQAATRVSVDVPSGLFADEHTSGTVFKADCVATFQLPKLAFFLAENQEYIGEWTVLDIGLQEEFISKTECPHETLTPEHIASLLKKRHRYDHKGTFGHALIIAGSYGKMGACILSAKAALRAGCGLITIHAPKAGYEILQIAFPEAMVIVDDHECVFTKAKNVQQYDAIGIGPGLGTNELTVDGLENLLQKIQKPLVIDADGLNILAKNPKLLERVPDFSILTPHPKEFERLFGETSDNFERLELARSKAQEFNLYIVLKGGHTCIATPEGKCYFNTTGNPGLATGGTGDVLTGIITGLLAQKYTSFEACVIGTYLHGLSGDIAAAELEQEALLAGDVIDHLGKAYKRLKGI